MIYADTSFLLSLYLAESSSGTAIASARQGTSLLLTQLNELEFENAIQLRVFRRELTITEAASVVVDFRRNIAEGGFTMAGLPDGLFATAAFLSKRWTAALGVRSLDILHVASALLLKAEGFYTFDKNQNKLARREGLKTL